MAFNNIMQLATAHIIKYLSPNPTVIELGNQRFRYNMFWVEKCAKVSGKTIRKPVKHVWDYFEDLGFSNYAAIDINEHLKAIPMDLNYILKDKYNYTTQHDLVTNNGTGEHIFDQRTVFENMHNLTKTNGVMLNVLPFFPWINHAFYNYHPILFRDIATANNYQWCFLWIAQNTGSYIDCKLQDWIWFEQKKIKNPVSKLEEVYYSLGDTANISIVAAYKKVEDKPFVVPMQGRYVNDISDKNIAKEYHNPDVRQSDHTYEHLT